MNQMFDLIENFPKHLLDALQIAQKSSLSPSPRKIENVVITGLGGSGIGAGIARDLLAKHSQVPICVNKDYEMPAFINEHTLVIACSYSGNTEETLMALESALDHHCMVAVICSGGKAEQIAKKHHLNMLQMPGGNPPRSMLGYSLMLLLWMLHHYEINRLPLINDVEQMAHWLQENKKALRTQAKEYADLLKGKIISVYACEGFAGIGERFRQQLNENAKMLGWNAAIPEMNHNELVGWSGGSDAVTACFISTPFDNPRNAKRLEINREIVGRYTPHVYTIGSEGDTPLRAALYLIHLTDFISYELSEINQVDIMDIHAIDYLKSELEKF